MMGLRRSRESVSGEVPPRSVPESRTGGKTFKADLSEEGFEVSGDECNWRVRWRGVRVKGENESVLVLYGANTVFIFGKKYLSHEQQQEFRKLAGL
jgi:hypothetical protein